MTSSNLLKTTFLALLVALGACLGACAKNTESTFVSEDSSVNSDNPDLTPERFFVEAKSNSYYATPLKLHKFNDFNSPCSITRGDPAEDMKCMVNINERDLAYIGIELIINVGPGICRYVTEEPYWYYNWEPGFGPGSISITREQASSDDAYAITACTYSAGSAVVDSGKCNLFNSSGQAIGTVDTEGLVSGCRYDYSAIEGAPNCCLGGYTTRITSTTNSSPPVTTPSQVSGTYNGDVGLCTGGSATIDWDYIDDGIPFGKISTAYDGYVTTYKVKPTHKVNGGASNIFNANFFDWATYRAGTWSDTVPTRPKPIQPRGVTAGYYTNEAYTYVCTDQNAEVKYRIRVYINEWDTLEQYEDYIASEGALGNPNAYDADSDGVRDRDGTDCDVGNSVAGYCDDYFDWDTLTEYFDQYYPGEDPFPMENNDKGSQ